MSTRSRPPGGARHSRIPPGLFKRALGAPDLLYHVLQAEAAKHVWAPFQKAVDGRQSAHLRQVSLKITDLCNLRCKTCGQWGETGYNLDKPLSELRARTVSFERYCEMVDEIAHLRPFYYIWGGEPFIYPKLVPLMAYMKEKGGFVGVVTNGTFLEAHAQALVDMQLDQLMLSIDGTPDVHDAIRKQKGCFDKLWRGLDAVLKARGERPRPFVNILMTVSRDNVDNLVAVAEMLQARGGIDLFTVYYSWFTSRGNGLHHTDVMEQRFGVTPTSWHGYLFFQGLDTARLQQEVETLKARTWSFHPMLIPDLDIDQIPLYYGDPTETFGYGGCIQPWIVTEIMPNGDVATCRDYPDYVCGNIKTESLLSIWNNEKYQRFRSVLKEEGLLPICARCCGLMGW
ncbi:MAG TPA: radical SAM protein [Candidatus Xenobia bacterium]